jgi:hypothetical protein
MLPAVSRLLPASKIWRRFALFSRQSATLPHPNCVSSRSSAWVSLPRRRALLFRIRSALAPILAFPPITMRETRMTHRRPGTTNPEFRITNRQSPTTNRLSPTTNRKSRIKSGGRQPAVVRIRTCDGDRLFSERRRFAPHIRAPAPRLANASRSRLHPRMSSRMRGCALQRRLVSFPTGG